MCCCCYTDRNVISVDATADPVVLTVNGLIPAGACFKLRLMSGMLINVNTNVVNVTDGTNTWELRSCCSGDQVRYDSLMDFVDSGCGCSVCKTIKCHAGTDTDPFVILVREKLPRSSFVPAAVAADAGGGN